MEFSHSFVSSIKMLAAKSNYTEVPKILNEAGVKEVIFLYGLRFQNALSVSGSKNW